ncbi:Uncharacterised protein family UPF0272 [Acididesulfobacillus acetoxydans]|uniref:UPF0272 protein DICTH 1434 n=1 Tax=Acididesulfobacillus acetoxydans TaxID=1561005 RepID=A0A8S0XXN3_9FIRM|nr:LarC family nickel insertion protein [Acididesulfobacillus acetoxydans]CAA7601877.1 Uncharacterised protein family UPF0272 [Acididesulfobacillus acetoxydans]CEJ08279.1 UPF0272 protein DICTH 1434 [Acididesulfobacillus acetoxydans]
MRILYWDAFAGISGDMALGSLIALGADPAAITESLRSTGLHEFELAVDLRRVQGIQATDVDVRIEQGSEAQGPPHRGIKEIGQMIAGGGLTETARENALKVFGVLARAEAKVHGTTVEEVHFHEVGAVDSLVDIVGTVVALDLLNIQRIRVSVLPWSRGFVRCAHGTLPVPAPAALEILAGFRFRESGVEGELVTPTGAALLAALAEQGEFPEMAVAKVGYGSGKNNYGLPSLLRAVQGEI